MLIALGKLLIFAGAIVLYVLNLSFFFNSSVSTIVAMLTLGLQVIVVDHAKLDDDNFREEIIEDWKNPNNNLVPTDW